MQTAAKTDFISVEDYLAEEIKSPVRHEYLGGQLYAMAGETREHNRIIGNLYFQTRSHLKGSVCQLFTSDVRVNLNLRTDDYFYYPDLVVTCDKRDTHPRFVRFPKLIIEVLSECTERTDKQEKFFAYTQIDTLEEYVLVAQATREVTVFRRANQWKAEVYAGAKAVAPLKSLKLKLPLKDIYEGV